MWHKAAKPVLLMQSTSKATPLNIVPEHKLINGFTWLIHERLTTSYLTSKIDKLNHTGFKLIMYSQVRPRCNFFSPYQDFAVVIFFRISVVAFTFVFKLLSRGLSLCQRVVVVFFVVKHGSKVVFCARGGIYYTV